MKDLLVLFGALLVLNQSCKGSGSNSVDSENQLPETLKFDIKDLMANNSDSLRVTENLHLPPELNSIPVQWEISEPDLISSSGEVTRPRTVSNVPVTLRAFNTQYNLDISFQVNVASTLSGNEKNKLITESIQKNISSSLEENQSQDVHLPKAEDLIFAEGLGPMRGQLFWNSSVLSLSNSELERLSKKDVVVHGLSKVDVKVTNDGYSFEDSIALSINSNLRDQIRNEVFQELVAWEMIKGTNSLKTSVSAKELDLVTHQWPSSSCSIFWQTSSDRILWNSSSNTIYYTVPGSMFNQTTFEDLSLPADLKASLLCDGVETGFSKNQSLTFLVKYPEKNLIEQEVLESLVWAKLNPLFSRENKVPFHFQSKSEVWHDLVLPNLGPYGIPLKWTSSNPNYLEIDSLLEKGIVKTRNTDATLPVELAVEYSLFGERYRHIYDLNILNVDQLMQRALALVSWDSIRGENTIDDPIPTITKDIYLRTDNPFGLSFKWTSSHYASKYIDSRGKVRPNYLKPSLDVTYTLWVEVIIGYPLKVGSTTIVGRSRVNRPLFFKVPYVEPDSTDQKDVEQAVWGFNPQSLLSDGDGSLSYLSKNLTLPSSLDEGISVTWSSENSSVVSNEGHIFRKKGVQAEEAKLIASFSKGEYSSTLLIDLAVSPAPVTPIETNNYHLYIPDTIYELEAESNLKCTQANLGKLWKYRNQLFFCIFDKSLSEFELTSHYINPLEYFSGVVVTDKQGDPVDAILLSMKATKPSKFYCYDTKNSWYLSINMPAQLSGKCQPDDPKLNFSWKYEKHDNGYQFFFEGDEMNGIRYLPTYQVLNDLWLEGS